MSTAPAAVTKAPSGFVRFFEKVGHDIVVAEQDVKKVFIKAAAETPAISAFLTEYGGEAESLLANVSPAASLVLTAAIKSFGAVANAINAGGAAAESNFLNAGLDQATIDAVKAAIPAVKSVAGPKPAAPSAT